MALTGKQKAFLKSKAHSMSPLVQIGKQGLTDESLKQMAELLEKRELIKVTLLQNASISVDEASAQIETSTGADVVQKIGKVMVVYKPSSKEKNQKISSELPK